MMRRCCILGALAALLGGALPARAQESPLDPPPRASEFFDLTLEEMLAIDMGAKAQRKAALYGFLRTNVEKVWHVPELDAQGRTRFDSDPLEWSLPAFHLYGAAKLIPSVDVLFNLAGSDTGLEVRNAYGNLKLHEAVQLRLGRQYRRFDLFNDKLDQTPAILGIEPPELFDQDHLLLPRTTLACLHGRHPLSSDLWFFYALTTDNGEAGAEAEVIPIGWDFRVKGANLVAGTSGFASSLAGGRTSPSVAVGQGAPAGGIVPWMRDDRYFVVGAFVELERHGLLLQGSYFQARHDGRRDPDRVLEVVRGAGLIPSQRARFLGPGAAKADPDLLPQDVIVGASYVVHTFYVRAGYSIPSSIGTFTPYAFIDWMKHPEAIRAKSFGGDNEAGFADDGEFWKPSLGVVYNPIAELALKLDGSAHVQTFNGRTELYPEVRFDAAFAFKLLD